METKNELAAKKTAELVAMGTEAAMAELKRRIEKREKDGKHPVASTIEAYNALVEKLGGTKMKVPEYRSKGYVADASVKELVEKIVARGDATTVMTELAGAIH